MLFILKKYWDKILLVILIVSYVLIFSYLSIARHNAFASGFDLGNMDQTIWNTLHGNFYSLTGSTGTVSRFSIHADLILILLAPFYLLWNDVRMLLILQSVFLGLSVIPVYLLARKVIGDKFIAIILGLAFLFTPGVQWTNIYDFHPSSLSIFFLLWTFYFAWVKKWKWYFLSAFLLLLCKETTSLTIAMLGFLIAVVQKEYKIGIVSFFIGIVWFTTMIVFVIPYFSPDHKYWALSWVKIFNSAGNNSMATPGEQNLISKYILAPDAKNYYLQLLKPYLFIPLLGVPWLFVIFPRLSINLVSEQAQMRSVNFHYDSTIQAGLIIALIFAFSYMILILKKVKIKSMFKPLLYTFSLMILVSVLRMNYHYSPLPTTPSCWCFMYEPTKEDREFETLLRAIPQSASVTASPEIRPHITHREVAYTLPSATDSADFIALIDQNRIIGNYNPKEYELVLRDQLVTSKKYKLVKRIGHFYLYRKVISSNEG